MLDIAQERRRGLVEAGPDLVVAVRGLAEEDVRLDEDLPRLLELQRPLLEALVRAVHGGDALLALDEARVELFEGLGSRSAGEEADGVLVGADGDALGGNLDGEESEAAFGFILQRVRAISAGVTGWVQAAGGDARSGELGRRRSSGTGSPPG